MWSNVSNNSSTSGGFLDESRKGGDTSDDIKKKRLQTATPLLISFLQNADDPENLKLFDNPIRNVSIVGKVRRVEDATTKISYEIEDDSGSIQALRWLEADKRVPETLVPVDTYVRVYGMPRNQNNKVYVLALHISPLKSLNELTNHLLEVTHKLLEAQASANRQGQDSNRHMSANQGSSMEDTNYGMTADQSIVYNLIQAENHAEFGIERLIIKKRVPGHLAGQVDTILDFLVSEGHIYTTNTDDHFRST